MALPPPTLVLRSACGGMCIGCLYAGFSGATVMPEFQARFFPDMLTDAQASREPFPGGRNLCEGKRACFRL